MHKYKWILAKKNVYKYMVNVGGIKGNKESWAAIHFKQCPYFIMHVNFIAIGIPEIFRDNFQTIEKV